MPMIHCALERIARTRCELECARAYKQTFESVGVYNRIVARRFITFSEQLAHTMMIKFSILRQFSFA